MHLSVTDDALTCLQCADKRAQGADVPSAQRGIECRQSGDQQLLLLHRDGEAGGKEAHQRRALELLRRHGSAEDHVWQD